MRIVVTGREGQVVRALIEAGAVSGDTILPVGRPEMDLSDPQSIEATMREQDDMATRWAALTADQQAQVKTSCTGMTANADTSVMRACEWAGNN